MQIQQKDTSPLTFKSAMTKKGGGLWKKNKWIKLNAIKRSEKKKIELVLRETI